MAIDPTFLDQLKGLELLARRKVSSVYMGSRRSVRQGRGIEIADYREYYPGDDFRSIDWRVYARTERLYIRRFEEEKDLTLHILIDSSASMDFSVSGMRKFDYGGSIAVGFAYLAMSKYEKFASALFSDRITDVMQPKKGKMHFFRMVELLNNAIQKGKTDLEKCIGQYTNMIKSRSFIIVISDFIEPMESLEYAIYRIAKYSKEAILVQILDPGEISLRWTDDVRFEDMESLKSERTFLSPDFKKRYQERLKEHISGIQEICDDTGVEFYSITTDTPLFDAFVGIVEK
ncbi:MAG: DUF58 domain-containing protein [Candidatus Altiarchaeales archaeon ex4484_43]|nr:MAG: DUF58 domain-containing protein [Candidatus Altiarchaeales archaeon ex4484_43]